MPTWETKLFTIHDDLNFRIDRCCGTRSRTTVAGSCGTCRLDDQLRETITRYIEAGDLQRPPDMVRIVPREAIDPMFREAAASGFEPLTEEQAGDFREKLRGVSAAIHGGKR